MPSASRGRTGGLRPGGRARGGGRGPPPFSRVFRGVLRPAAATARGAPPGRRGGREAGGRWGGGVGGDLGTVEPQVTTTLHERGMLSSAVLYFQRDYETDGHPFVPIRSWEPHSMASISTHDLPTAAGFLRAQNV